MIAITVTSIEKEGKYLKGKKEIFPWNPQATAIVSKKGKTCLIPDLLSFSP